MTTRLSHTSEILRDSIPSWHASTSGKEGKEYLSVATPVKLIPDLEGGALTAGGAPDLYSKDCIGLLANYAAVGIIFGTFPRTVYPFLNNYLGMDGFQAVAATSLVSMPWSFKTFIGILSDSFPILGYRRRPYMVIGWLGCGLILSAMAFMPVGDPFYLFPEDRNVPIEGLDPSRLNLHAPSDGAQYILMMMFASFFYVIADVAADGMVVEFARREPENVRGNTQTTIYMIRTIFSTISIIIVGFCMNGKDYGGSFDFSLAFNQIMILLAVASFLTIIPTIFFLKEKKVEREHFKSRCGVMWKIVQQRAVWQIMAMKFFGGLFSSWQASPGNIVQKVWAEVAPITEAAFSIVGSVLFAVTLYATKRWGLQWDWRRTIIITTLFTIAIDTVVSYFTIFDIYRNQWFWLGVPILEEFPMAVHFIISTYVVVEIADDGYEGATYGLLTTITNLSSPVAGSISNNVNAYFDAFKEDILRDDTYAREQVALVYTLAYGMKIVSLAWLVLLPRQKKEAQELKRNGGSSALAGGLALFLAGCALIYAVLANMLSVFESTACLTFAGGKGC